MTDTALEEQLFTAVGKKQGHRPPHRDCHRVAPHPASCEETTMSQKPMASPRFFNGLKIALARLPLQDRLGSMGMQRCFPTHYSGRCGIASPTRH
jgi:hypothetical protein